MANTRIERVRAAKELYNNAIASGISKTEATRQAKSYASAPTTTSTYEPRRTTTTSSSTITPTPTTTTRLSGATTVTDGNTRTSYNPEGEVFSTYTKPTTTTTPAETITDTPVETPTVEDDTIDAQVIVNLLNKYLGETTNIPNKDEFMASRQEQADLGASLKYDSVADNLKTRTQNILNDLTNRISGLDREYAPALTDLRNQKYQSQQGITRDNLLRGIQGTGIGEAEQKQLDAIYGGQRSNVLRDRITSEQDLRTEMMNIENTLNTELANIDRDKGTYKEQALLKAQEDYENFLRTGNQQDFENAMTMIDAIRGLKGDEEAIRQFNEEMEYKKDTFEKESETGDERWKAELQFRYDQMSTQDKQFYDQLTQDKNISDADRNAKLNMFTADLLQENAQFEKDYGLRKSELVNKHILGLKAIDVDNRRLDLMNKEIDNAFKVDNLKISQDKFQYMQDRVDRLNQQKIENEQINREITLKENEYNDNQKQAMYNYMQKLDADMFEAAQAISEGVVSETEGAYMISDMMRTAKEILPMNILQQKADSYQKSGLIEIKDKTTWDKISTTMDYWTKDLGTYYKGIGQIWTGNPDELLQGGNQIYNTTTASGIYNSMFDDILNR